MTFDLFSEKRMAARSLLTSALLIPASLAACGAQVGCDPQPASSAADPSGQIVLADSAAWDTGAGELIVHRVLFGDEGREASIPGFFVRTTPGVTGEQQLVAVAYGDDGLSVVRVDLRTREREVFALPDDALGHLSEPAFSPDGRYLAYVAFTGGGAAQPIVRRWPDHTIVCRGPAVELEPTNFLLNAARWQGEAFEIYLDLAHEPTADDVATPHRGWLRVRGSPRHAGLTVDTFRHDVSVARQRTD